MIPQELFLKGAIGVKRGLDLDEIYIDFTQFQPGVIAIIGRNGVAKSTIIENMTPYRTLLSRKGKLSNHFEGANARREFHFNFNGDNYISLLEINNSSQRSTLFKNDVPLTDGTSTTYDAKVEEIFGSLNLFRHTIFSAQGADKLGDLQKADRKDLFIELLDLSRYARYETFAKGKRDTLVSSVQHKRGQIEVLRKTAGLKDSTYVALNNAIHTYKNVQGNLEVAKENERNTTQEVHEINVELATAQTKLLAYTQTNQQYEVSMKQRSTNVMKAEELLKELDRNIFQLTDSLKTQKGLCSSGVLTSATENYNNVVAWQNHYEELLRKRNQKNTLLHQISSIETKVKIHETELLSLGRRLEEVQQLEAAGVPCVSYDENLKYSCKAYSLLIKEDSLTIDKAIYSIKKSIEELKNQAIGLYSQLEVNQVEDKEIEEAKQHASFLSQMRAALERCQNSTERVQELELQIQSTQQTRDKHFENCQNIQREWDETIARLKEELERTKAEVPENINGLNQQHNFKVQQLDKFQREVKNLQAALQDCSSQVAVHEAKLAEIEEAKVQLVSLENEVAKADAEVLEWNLITNACNRSGIPSLEISQAGGELTQLANNLLIDCFDSDFTITFETLTPRADGKGFKESFDIIVHRENERLLLENLSGGEETWVQQALVEAASIYSRLYSNRKFMTAFCDETESSLDSINRMSYYRMREQVHKLCGLVYTFYISHDPAVINFIPQRISLSKENGITIEV